MAAIGVPLNDRWKLLQSLALDCLPQLRRKILTYLVNLRPADFTPTPSGRRSLPCLADTSTIARDLDYPTTTVRRGLEDLAGHGIVLREKSEKGKADLWKISHLCMDLVDQAGFPNGALPPLSED
jgi:hypothetical protein